MTTKKMNQLQPLQQIMVEQQQHRHQHQQQQQQQQLSMI
jgi:hypothetical protein